MASTIILKNGTGSAVPSSLTHGELAINVDNGALFYGTSGSSNAVSSSFLLPHISSSTITASGDISASGEIYGKGFHVPANINDGYHIGDGKPILAIAGEGGYLSLGAGHPTYNAAGVKIFTTGSDENAGLFLDSVGNVTASGNISSSGNINANQYNIQGKTLTTFASDILRHGFDSSLVKYSYGKDSDNEHLFYGNVTASNNISASGIIYSDALDASTISSSKIILNGEITNHNDPDTKIAFASDDTFDIQTGNAIQLRVTPAGANFNSGNVTASGDISASGNIIGDIHSDHINSIGNATRGTNIGYLGTIAQAGNDPSMRFTNSYDVSVGDADEAGEGTRIEVKESNHSITLFSNVTSSGNISASGNVIAKEVIINRADDGNPGLQIYHATENLLAQFESGDTQALIEFKDNSTTVSVCWV